MVVETQASPLQDGGPDDSDPKVVDKVIVRFAGDSGDGMQVTGSFFTHNSALVGNDISTLPDFPAEIRAPAGTLPGVSGFQLNFSSLQIMTPGDTPEVLVAMNPAALKVNLRDLVRGGTIILNSDTFRKNNLKKAGYTEDPRETGDLEGYDVHAVPLTSLTLEAVKDTGISHKLAGRCKNMFALGIMLWMYDRPLETTLALMEKKFGKMEEVFEANKKALSAGYNYADTVEVFTGRFKVGKAKLEPGTYRMLMGNQATVLGFVAASKLAQRPLFYGSYPITPASSILEGLATFKHFGVRTFQAEDEMAAVGSAIGASFGGAIGLTGTSGPGVALKAEAIGLAVMTELPLIIINVQRGGPSTGLPTKTEQADLLQAMFGRNGECPVAIVAPQSPGDCFTMALEATRIAVTHMVPVIYLSDGYLANGAEPWNIPSVADLPVIEVNNATDPEGFLPYQRDPETLARPWAIPGTAGLEHRLGGLEKQEGTGNVSYDPDNHQKMIELRAEKVARIARSIPDLEVHGDPEGDLLVLGWGSTYGSITSAVNRARGRSGRVSSAHLRHLNPFPANLEEVLGKFKKILIPELNMGQLLLLIRARFCIDAIGLNKVQGQPFQIGEIEQKIEELL
ncbi:MAG: 2-oxoglutarate ferredoxin oxidoreductase subunit alpha [Planctomycetes bacterium]|nr:2-oxoglutarate ferredoxin oxidoreductase subunit alpha [Planctomycetota bacterium]